MRPLCVIPARRGSKRLREKNILPLGGKPMLAWSVEAALESGVFDAVHVSTEDEAIGEIAAGLGAAHHRRPAELAGDLVSATDVCLDVLEARERGGEEHDAVICLQPSSPLRTSEEIARAWKRFSETDADYLVSATAIDPHYFHWALREKGGDWGMYFGDDFMVERPLLPPVYRPNGSIKIARTGPLNERRNFFGPNLRILKTPEETSVHVATRMDFDICALILEHRTRKT